MDRSTIVERLMSRYVYRYVHPTAVPYLAILAVMMLSIIGLMIFKGGITGFVLGPMGTEYVDEMNLTINESQDLMWYPSEFGKIGSIKFNGRLIRDSGGTVRTLNLGTLT